MTRRHVIAVAVALGAIFLSLALPIWVRATGDEVAIALEPVDPLSLFRGNYVDLNYDVEVDLPNGLNWDDPVYVVFDDARPANAVRASVERPTLANGETCIRGKVSGRARERGNIEFPELEQFFVTPAEGRRLERDLDNMVGVLKTTGSCRAILITLEPI